MLRLNLFLLAAVLAVTALFAPSSSGVSDGPAGTADPEPRCATLTLEQGPAHRNLVLIINDAMRRDAPGIYGGSARTPVFDGFAGEHLLFERAFAQAPWTKPSIATLFTSFYPSQHRVASHPGQSYVSGGPLDRPIREFDVLSSEYDTLAEVLVAAGYRTAAINANPWLDSRFGFEQGFEVYDDSFGRWSANGGEVSDASIAWLKTLDSDAPFFLYVHYVDSHRPYQALDDAQASAALAAPSEESVQLSERALNEISHIVSFEKNVWPNGLKPTPALVARSYKLGVEAFDTAFQPLLEVLRARGDWSRTAVIVTSDHGEALYDRGYGNHATGLHEDELAIPMAARLPGVTATQGRVECTVGLIDLMPSMCLYLGLECPAMQGTSFLREPGSSEALAPRYLVSEGVAQKPRNRAIRNDRWKLLYEPQGTGGKLVSENPTPYRLYDLEQDPGETRDLLDPHLRTDRVAPVERRLRDALPEAVSTVAAPTPGKTPGDRELESRLRALGYLDEDEGPLP